MPQESRELVVLCTRGSDHELSSVAFTIACGGITSGLKVTAFLTSSAVDLVRKKAVDVTHVPPLDPLKALIDERSILLREPRDGVLLTPASGKQRPYKEALHRR